MNDTREMCLLRECQDYDKIYGIVLLNNVSIQVFQQAIYNAKNEFYDSDYDNWCIEDIMAKLSEIYDFKYYQFNDNDYLEI